MKKLNEELLVQKTDGPFDHIDGAYLIKHPTNGELVFRVIASSLLMWDHVSVSVHVKSDGKYFSLKRCPTWGEMAWVKDKFFETEEWAMQFHPAHSEYINNARYCLHIWRPHIHFATPQKDLVGSDAEATKPTYDLEKMANQKFKQESPVQDGTR